MKNLLVIIAIVFTCLAASCTQRTCPTYTKGIQENSPEQQEQVEQDQNV